MKQEYSSVSLSVIKNDIEKENRDKDNIANHVENGYDKNESGTTGSFKD